jgi:tripartite ATP-independent transporter DctP family solute receptor
VVRQFHNQPEDSHQHRFLVELWDEVKRRTAGELDVAVHASNANVVGSDPRVLEMLAAGEVEFATMMGPLLAACVPAMEIQGVPFAFGAAEHAHAALDGALGQHLRSEMRAHGLSLLGTFDNGMRHVCSVSREVREPRDLERYRMRVPNAPIFAELFEALGATPLRVNIDGLYTALRDEYVDGHENPLAITEVNRLHEVTRCISLTAHAWSGFNLVANRRFWKSLDSPAREAVRRAVKSQVAAQRAYTARLNAGLETTLAGRGMRILPVDRLDFRRRVGTECYVRWKERCGAIAWRLLEASVGSLVSA